MLVGNCKYGVNGSGRTSKATIGRQSANEGADAEENATCSKNIRCAQTSPCSKHRQRRKWQQKTYEVPCHDVDPELVPIENAGTPSSPTTATSSLPSTSELPTLDDSDGDLGYFNKPHDILLAASSLPPSSSPANSNEVDLLRRPTPSKSHFQQGFFPNQPCTNCSTS
ncbi:hypothetical protein BDN72DRAFT_850641 [Pluteus cervinus]|uniref:Uncharacterized protein n=1 Tax=Pluteus cervinus TaxID=181527 RepID=A0ACD3A4F8_9AGAR|nr:hypothetical protein BDN72DRAFT_850641 [Pluteus cervinus]